jgi:hypothetical protein
MMADDANTSDAQEDVTTTHTVRRASDVGNVSLDEVLSAIRALLRSEHPMAKRPRLRLVASDARLPAEAVQTTRLPVKS